MKSLRVLNLNNNFLTTVEEKLFQDMNNVVQLSACNNSISEIDENASNNLK